MTHLLNRNKFIAAIQASNTTWDFIVIGGGATGLGIAMDAASRGYKVVLLEQSDFAKGTSSRSTKLIHGGVRYLAQGNIRLVYEALHERGLLIRNAPHLIKIQSFIIPVFNFKDALIYTTGMKIYDWMAGRLSLGSSNYLSRKTVRKLLPGINPKNLMGGVRYFDGQFDDTRTALNIAQTCVEQGGIVLNYMKVTSLIKNSSGRITGVSTTDLESGTQLNLSAHCVINATGVFVDDILKMDLPTQKQMVRPSQGVHIVLDKSFLPGQHGLMIPKTRDGRVLFVVPWQDHLLVGTTDTPLNAHSLEPKALDQEIDFILDTAQKYLIRKPLREDVLSVFAGLRPLAADQKNKNNTKEISRRHSLSISDSKLVTITGGKWTTFRQMAEHTVDEAIRAAALSPKPCKTEELKIHGYTDHSGDKTVTDIYGKDGEEIAMLIKENPVLSEKLHKDLPYIHAQVIFAVRNEMARTVEDVLARRTRALFLDAKIAMNIAKKVGELMAGELQQDSAWVEKQVKEFNAVAKNYLIEQPQTVESN